MEAAEAGERSHPTTPRGGTRTWRESSYLYSTGTKCSTVPVKRLALGPRLFGSQISTTDRTHARTGPDTHGCVGFSQGGGRRRGGCHAVTWPAQLPAETVPVQHRMQHAITAQREAAAARRLDVLMLALPRTDPRRHPWLRGWRLGMPLRSRVVGLPRTLPRLGVLVQRVQRDARLLFGRG